jgi:acyl-CoA hydrolase
VGVECTKAAAERARTVIALVNRQMPRSLGDAFIHVSRLGSVVEVDIASLHGKSLRERARELIAVAHPDFREELRAAACRRKLI